MEGAPALQIAQGHAALATLLWERDGPVAARKHFASAIHFFEDSLAVVAAAAGEAAAAASSGGGDSAAALDAAAEAAEAADEIRLELSAALNSWGMLLQASRAHHRMLLHTDLRLLTAAYYCPLTIVHYSCVCRSWESWTKRFPPSNVPSRHTSRQSALPPTHHSPLTTHHAPLTTHHSQFTTRPLLATCYSLLATRYSLLANHYSLLTTH